MIFFRNTLLIFLKRNPNIRRLILIILDLVLVYFSILLSLSFINDSNISLENIDDFGWIYQISIILALPFYILTNNYKGLTRYTDSRNVYISIIRNYFLYLFVYLIGLLNNLSSPGIRFWILVVLFTSGLGSLIRFLIRDLLILIINSRNENTSRVAIYGAGMAGEQLARNLLKSKSHEIKAFIDDNIELQNRSLHGIPIYSSFKLSALSTEIDQLLLAIPSATNYDRKRILRSIEKYKIPILCVPSIEELTSGNIEINYLRSVPIEDILGRNSVLPDQSLLESSITNKNVLITGAGGSIGSELCRQIANLKPNLLFMLDNSEFNLYTIEQQLISKIDNHIVILGNACDCLLIEKLFMENNIDIVFHAAAYKHVPLVESNKLEGISNNVISTKVICDAAIKFDIGQVVLVSTDKAVRPTNVMGASKRLGEMIIQCYADKNIKNKSSSMTKFSMVRFGNVLGSSGSVVQKFKQQISNGGPITLTHPEMIRYFMTIPEASELVIQSAGLAEGGDVFILDMGEPVKIIDLAKKIIKLSGLKLKDKLNPNGDIEIVIGDLRPGEKLFEELLINDQAKRTKHPLIYKANEDYMPEEEFLPLYNLLLESLEAKDEESSLNILSEIVKEWERS